MRIAVTGGSGKLGRTVVSTLTEAGHDVVNLDVAGGRDDTIRVDFTDYGQTLDALLGVNDRHQGVDALVHLAAIPAPGIHSDVATFDNNMLSTFHVLYAAKRAGIKNIVTASSETVLGLPFETPPPYIPVDEEYPARPESVYSLTKHLEEQMEIELTRWDPELKIVALRFSNVMYEEDYAEFEGFDTDANLRKWNLWGYIDSRDVAAACRLSLDADVTGASAFIIAAADTIMDRPSRELLAEVFPGVELTREVGEFETLLAIDAARAALGFEPAQSWRTQPEISG